MKIKSFLVINHNSRTWCKLLQKYFIVSRNPIEESLFATSGNNIFVIQDLKLQTPTTKNCRKLNFGKQMHVSMYTQAHVAHDILD